MKILIKILILISILSTGCIKNENKEHSSIDKMGLAIEIIPDFGDTGYSISWKDTLCSEFKNEWNYLDLRPYELYCYITNRNNDTLGYYRGLSTPRQFTYFDTKSEVDSIIKIDFSVGINHFSEFLAKQTPEYIDQFNHRNKERIVFEKVEFNLNRDLRKKVSLELARKR